MLYDKTTIAIHERGIMEIADVSLHVIRDYWRPLLFYFAMAVLPLMLLNYFLIGWMTGIDFAEGSLTRYAWNMILLVAAEAQLATIFVTFYLGQALFGQTMKVRTVLWESVKISLRVVWCHGVIRALLAVWALYLLLMVTDNGFFNEFMELLVIPAIVLYALLVRGLRPFVTELLALEKNPMRGDKRLVITLGARSRALHGPIVGEAMGRALFSAIIACLFALALTGSVLFVWDFYFLLHNEIFLINHILFPLCLWAVAGFMFVIRFLSYLDIRTRQEGWEVELRMRAEAVELRRQLGEIHE